LAGSGSAAAQGGESPAQALARAFPPPATVERRTAFLDEPARVRVAEASGSDRGDVPGVVTYYVGRHEDEVVGYAYFDAHTVRTRRELLMVRLDRAGAIVRIEVLRFAEPPEYRPPERWLEAFEGRDAAEQLAARREIVGLTGATLTAAAVRRAARRILAIHRLVAADGRGPQ
ncbi:MAG: FMN-binding protein, partial [Gemmatimonadota bacterium]